MPLSTHSLINKKAREDPEIRSERKGWDGRYVHNACNGTWKKVMTSTMYVGQYIGTVHMDSIVRALNP